VKGFDMCDTDRRCVDSLELHNLREKCDKLQKVVDIIKAEITTATGYEAIREFDRMMNDLRESVSVKTATP
jgi:hypothetical protein